jgi:hypothetical protein
MNQTVNQMPETPAPEATGRLEIVDPTGDTKLEWNQGNQVEVEAARASFDTHRRKGYHAYRMASDGSRGEVIREFDPAAQRIIMAPPVQGG